MIRKLIIAIPIVLSACQMYDESARVMYPVQRCGYVEQPVYGVLNRPASGAEVFGGAAIGGVIGNQLTNDAAGTIIGGLIGGSIANQRKSERVIVDTRSVYRCRTVYE